MAVRMTGLRRPASSVTIAHAGPAAAAPVADQDPWHPRDPASQAPLDHPVICMPEVLLEPEDQQRTPDTLFVAAQERFEVRRAVWSQALMKDSWRPWLRLSCSVLPRRTSSCVFRGSPPP